MPRQETFASATTAHGLIQILKTYDVGFAREAFDQMDEKVTEFLYKSLRPDLAEVVSLENEPDALWEEIQDSAREDWNTFSYFVVAQTSLDGMTKHLFVCADWPTADRFMQQEVRVATAAGVS